MKRYLCTLTTAEGRTVAQALDAESEEEARARCGRLWLKAGLRILDDVSKIKFEVHRVANA